MAEKIVENKVDEAMECYENIREALSGLYEIVKINFTENDFYGLAAIDNLKAINENMIKLLKDSHNEREIRIRLREIEFDEKEAEKNFPL